MGERTVGSWGWTWTHCCILNGEPTRTCCGAEGTLLRVLWEPGREGGLGGTDTCVCATESFHRSLKTITTLFINQPYMAQMVTNLPTIQVTWVQSLGREDPLEKKMATHSSILARRIP